MRPITAADLMNPKVLAVREDMTLRELAAYLIHHQITGAPVEDGGGRLVGVVSTVDIAEAMRAGPADADAGAAAGADLGSGPGADVEAGPPAARRRRRRRKRRRRRTRTSPIFPTTTSWSATS